MYSAKKRFSPVCCRIPTILLPCEAIYCSSEEPGSFALRCFHVTICLPLWSCRDSSGIRIRRPWSRTSCPIPWECASCASSLLTGIPAAGWASGWRCTAAPTVSNTHPGVKPALWEHSAYTPNLSQSYIAQKDLFICASGSAAKPTWWEVMRTISSSLGFRTLFDIQHNTEMRNQKLNRQGVKDLNQMCKLDDEQLQANVGTSGELRVSLLKVLLIPSTPALWEKEYCFQQAGWKLVGSLTHLANRQHNKQSTQSCRISLHCRCWCWVSQQTSNRYFRKKFFISNFFMGLKPPEFRQTMWNRAQSDSGCSLTETHAADSKPTRSANYYQIHYLLCLFVVPIIT